MRIFFLFMSIILIQNSFGQTRRSSTTTPVVNTSGSKGTSSSSSTSPSSTNNSFLGTIDKENAKPTKAPSKIVEIDNEPSLSKAVAPAISPAASSPAMSESVATPVSASQPNTTTLNAPAKTLGSSAREEAATVSPAVIPANAPNTAIEKAEVSNLNARIDARNRQSESLSKDIEFYNKLREQYEAEEKARTEKAEKDALEKAKKDEEAYQARHLKTEEAAQFEKFRNGAKNAEERKTSLEEDYNKLFK
jgi:hypothetical protein